MYKCMMFGGYPVTSGQVCDSFERGRPGTEKDAKAKYERPHHLHESSGSNHCRECTYYWHAHSSKISRGQADHIRHQASKLLS